MKKEHIIIDEIGEADDYEKGFYYGSIHGNKEVIAWFKEQGYENMNYSGFKIICNNAEKKYLKE